MMLGGCKQMENDCCTNDVWDETKESEFIQYYSASVLQNKENIWYMMVAMVQKSNKSYTLINITEYTLSLYRLIMINVQWR